ncbi:BatD family protein [Blastopirellula sp. JC732]|uniref:BatD family protein n=1 Tax=Blastopirellula sediminis TaxID=2894196 RepID=A0A9X1SLC6_9BACT|nr:BatD family protein [Blastopirellula sediminis]MCC9606147.1 BatD family protein [Blastopirellula sediminis]MCC9630554.1 BatD family protein [Blastopirellula sediminis]
MIFPTSPSMLSAIRRIVCAGLLLALFSTHADAAAITRTSTDGPVLVTATLENETAQIAEPVTLTLKVDVPENVLVTLPQEQAKLGTFNVLSATDTTDLPTANGREWIRRYQLESLTPGEQTIPPITIAYSDQRAASPTSDIVQSSPLSVTITSSLEGTPDPLQFRDIKGVVDLPAVESSSHFWLYGSLGGGALLALAGVALLVWPSRSSHLSAKDQALAELAELRRSDLLRTGQTDLFYVRLTNIVRHFVESQFAIAAPKLTTDEFLEQAATSSRLQGKQRAMLRVFLSLADLVKFAQFEPGHADADQAIDRAGQFIQQSAAEKPSETSPAVPQENA